MDGTCLDRRSRLTDKTLRALKKAADAGILLVPATGRALTRGKGRSAKWEQNV